MELAARLGFEAAAWRRYVERRQAADSAASTRPGRAMRLERMDERLRAVPAGTPGSSEEFERVRDVVRDLMARWGGVPSCDVAALNSDLGSGPGATRVSVILRRGLY